MAYPKAAPDSSSSARAVRGASFLIALQVCSRALTFLANQILLRFLTAALLGVSAQLEVYYLSVIFFARESLRVAIQRQQPTTAPSPDAGGKKDGGSKPATAAEAEARDTQAAVNLAYLSIPLGLAVAALLGWLYLASAPAAVLATPHLRPALYLYALAAAVELLSEPAFVVMQQRLQFGVRAAAEAAATLLRCAVTLGAAAWAARRSGEGGGELGALPFAMGQVCYGVGLLVVYGYCGARLARAGGFSMFPRRVGTGPSVARGFVYRATLNLAASMMAQSVLKHILTQGDTVLVSVLSTTTAQGVYALANNYGGLVARFVFQPVEESSRNYFSRLLSSRQPSKTNSDAPGSPEKTPAGRASQDLLVLLHLYTTFATLLLALAPAAAPLLTLVTGPRWAGSGAAETLVAYVWYVPLLAANGVLEAFVASVASEAEVHAQSGWMLGFSLVFAAAGYVCLRVLDMGAVGLVVANGVNMACRIVWCGVFIRRYFARAGVPFAFGGLMPPALGFSAAVVTRQVVARIAAAGRENGPRDQFMKLAKSAGVAVPFVLVLAFSERELLLQCYRFIRPQQATPAK